MKIVMHPNPQDMKTDLKRVIDRKADRMLAGVMTLGTRKVRMYRAKEEEAKIIKTRGGPIKKEDFPLLVREAELKGVDVKQLALLVIERANQTRAVEMELEALSTVTKARVDAATTPQEALLAYVTYLTEIRKVG